jgi:putative membrane protein
MSRKPLILGMVLLLGCAGCGGTDDADADAAADSSAVTAGQQPAAAAVTDAEIAAIVVGANTIDADLGDTASVRGTNTDIKAFGKTMSTDHRAVNAQAVELVTRLGVTPVESDISRKLASDAAAFRADLSGRTGAEFDRAYIDHEVAYHQAVIDALDTVLIPSAMNPELKQTLVGVRPAFVAHLEHARQLAAALK